MAFLAWSRGRIPVPECIYSHTVRNQDWAYIARVHCEARARVRVRVRVTWQRRRGAGLGLGLRLGSGSGSTVRVSGQRE
eukprot:scaffold80272_cov63-Phaeocystis_antarctica.AAC.1